VTVPVSRWAVEATSGAATGEVEGGVETPGPPEGEAASRPEADALPHASYFQLPQHLFWIREDAADQPVSLDGFFRTLRGGTLHVLAVAALHGGGSDGFRVLPLPGVPLADAPTWLATAMREEGEDFRSEMPGAELEGLYEIRTAGELLKLVARLDRFVHRFPRGRVAGASAGGTGDGASSAGRPGSPDPDSSGAAPAPGAPDYTRLILT
jgi:hypothetical protein